MKKIFVSIATGAILLMSGCANGNHSGNASGQKTGTVKTANATASNTMGEVIPLTNETFKQKIFNYDVNKQWKFEGNKPAIIDFYATWCGPCKMLSPRVEEIAKEYAGKIDVYKVDTDQEQVLSQNMGISSLPTLVFIPVDGKPQATVGALPKEALVKEINEVLLVK